MICKHDDCFTCPYPDCINDYVPPLVLTTEERKKQIRDRGKARYQERKDAGLCVECGDRPPATGKVRCNDCLRRNRNNARRSWQSRYRTMPKEMWGYLGLCTTCGKHPQEDGRKVCKECLAKSAESLKIARAARDPQRVSAWWKGNIT